jgi:small subunit ribosomal protein S1
MGEEARQDGTQSESMQQQGMEAVEPHPMASLLRTDFDVQELHRGQILEGVIVQVRPSEILVDVGAKSEGVIGGRELERLGSEGLSDLSEGDTLLAQRGWR